MARLSKGYYHCLECGALFEAVLKDPREQRCSHCGKPPMGDWGGGEDGLVAKVKLGLPRSGETLSPRPSAKVHGVSRDSQDIFEATKVSLSSPQEERDDKVSHSKRKEGKGSKPWLIVGVWLALMVGVVVLVKSLGSDELSDSTRMTQDEESKSLVAARKAIEKKRVVDEALPACQQAMIGFQRATTAAGKSQFVYQGVRLSGVMDRHYRDEFSYSSADRLGEIVRAELLDGFSQPAIGAICKNKTGEHWEVVFVFDREEWKIDWLSMVRYDDQPWLLFPAGKDGEEGEFRLYMRVRDSNEDFERKEMSLVFYKPTMRFKTEFEGRASIPVKVLIDSDLGRSITELLDKEDIQTWKTRKDKYGLSVGLIDPSRYHRVQVTMRLHKEGKDGRNLRLELLEILANDWYGLEP